MTKSRRTGMLSSSWSRYHKVSWRANKGSSNTGGENVFYPFKWQCTSINIKTWSGYSPLPETNLFYFPHPTQQPSLMSPAFAQLMCTCKFYFCRFILNGRLPTSLPFPCQFLCVGKTNKPQKNLIQIKTSICIQLECS